MLKSASKLSILSPGKLNLFLHINGQLPNGYHELQSVFQFFDHGDDMEFELNDTNSVNFSCNIDELSGNDNLIVKAAKALLNKSQELHGVNIHLHKRLPTGGGVGGGSSNAATTLLALNKLWELNLSIDELANIGLTLGADVPVFVRGYCAFAEGVGEKLTPYNAEEKWYLIAHPGCHISTQKIFTHPDLPRNTPKLNIEQLDHAHLHNDCEALVKKEYSEVAITLRWLVEYAPAKMTGTGACCFAEFDTESSALEAMKSKPDFVTCFVAKGLNRSPVHTALGYVF